MPGVAGSHLWRCVGALRSVVRHQLLRPRCGFGTRFDEPSARRCRHVARLCTCRRQRETCTPCNHFLQEARCFSLLCILLSGRLKVCQKAVPMLVQQSNSSPARGAMLRQASSAMLSRRAVPDRALGKAGVLHSRAFTRDQGHRNASALHDALLSPEGKLLSRHGSFRLMRAHVAMLSARNCWAGLHPPAISTPQCIPMEALEVSRNITGGVYTVLAPSPVVPSLQLASAASLASAG